jgi:hypothetical protein
MVKGLVKNIIQQKEKRGEIYQKWKRNIIKGVKE